MTRLALPQRRTIRSSLIIAVSGIGGFALGQDPALVTAGQGLIAPLIAAGGGALAAALIIRRQRKTTAPSPETQLPIAAHAPATIPPPAGITPQQQEMIEAIARVVHDIRTPMVALSTIAELLATGQTAPKTRELASRGTLSQRRSSSSRRSISSWTCSVHNPDAPPSIARTWTCLT